MRRRRESPPLSFSLAECAVVGVSAHRRRCYDRYGHMSLGLAVSSVSDLVIPLSRGNRPKLALSDYQQHVAHTTDTPRGVLWEQLFYRRRFA
jgi:hypothetical protein